MEKINLSQICENARTIGISGHIRPDGDCVASCLALFLYLQKCFPQKQIEVFLEKPPAIFDCLGGADRIVTDFPEREPFEVFFALDTVKDRMSGAEKYFDKAACSVNIDHHISNAEGCGMINYVLPDASSTAEVIYDLMDAALLDREIAKAIYVGMIHDTGVFRFSNTSPKTLRIAAELIAYGFDFPKLIDETFYEKTYLQNRILGRTLAESFLLMDGTCIVGSIDKKTMDLYGATSGDLDGIVNQLRITKGVETAVFLHETEDGIYKVSLRSCGGVDVAKVAVAFGGGGHVRAAGCTLKGRLQDITDMLVKEIEKQAG